MACLPDWRVQGWTQTLWFSVTTSATIGFGHQAPKPNCYGTNIIMMAQVLTSLLFQARRRTSP